MAYFGQNYLVMTEIICKNKKETFKIYIKGVTCHEPTVHMLYTSFPESYAVVESRLSLV